MMDQRFWRPQMKSSDQVEIHYAKNLLASQNEQQVCSQSSHYSNQRASRREAFNESQVFNSSPKPFVSSQTSKVRIDNVTKASTSSNSNDNQEQKIIRNQYNSPIDLYSMNNIKKTLDAHTELIAPGIKGINFLKCDQQINKRSEVYKLIKEEEEKSLRRQTIKQDSASPQSLPSQSSLDQHRSQVNTNYNEKEMNMKQTIKSLDHLNSYQADQIVDSRQQAQRGPICSECGQLIIGPYAKIQERCIHSRCFNCTTCGTSLKNTGYFTVNEKLYCEIHAEQVAKMLRIQAEFQALMQNKTNEQASSSTRDVHFQQQQQHKQQHQENLQKCSTIEDRPIQAPSIRITPSRSLDGGPPATISTMFADRSRYATDSNWKPPPSKQAEEFTLSKSESHQVSKSNQQQQQSHLSVRFKSRGWEEIKCKSGERVPVCIHCCSQIHGPYILAGKTTWCKPCSQIKLVCCSCRRSLLDLGFIEDKALQYFCEHCFETYYAPICFKCNNRIKGDCLNALGKQWHPTCFVCGKCHETLGNSSFYMEDNVPYCERDWKALFTTKCYSCSYPIEVGDKWIKALDRDYHSNCFKCTSCHKSLEGSTFHCKSGKPYCKLHY